MKTVAIIPCAGSGQRTGLEYNKILYNTGKITVIELTLLQFLKSEKIDSIIVIASENDIDKIRKITSNINTNKNILVIQGGNTRTDSIANALPYTKDYDYTLIHDGARPFVSLELIDKVITKVIESGAVITAIPVEDSLIKAYGGKILSNVDRTEYMQVQTPQAFISEELRLAYANRNSNIYTDDSSLYTSTTGRSVEVVIGNKSNYKITTIEDLHSFIPLGYAVGIGNDTHKLVEGRKLILGGLEIPYALGLLGHSDADVAVHALMDALLSAMGERDIGTQFPDSESAYKDISSMELLAITKKLLDKKSFIVNNISIVIIAEKPKLSEYIPKMQENIARTLDIIANKVNITATTTEKMGVIGEGKAIMAEAIVSIIKEGNYDYSKT